MQSVINMGKFLKKGNDGFRATLNGEYVDKSQLIEIINKTLNSERQFTCVSRARRFGKSIGAKMLYAYYDQWCDSRELFRGLKIADSPSFEQHFHRYPVIYIDMTDFITRYDADSIIDHLHLDVIGELSDVFSEVAIEGRELSDVLQQIVEANPYQEKFIMIIDEWDAILRERPEASERYINFLRGLFKSTMAMSTFAGVYMTGILPIKKYNTQSALNNFQEYSIIQPGPLAECFGFTSTEVRELCKKHGMEYSQLAEWYDGYQIGGSKEMFNPTSVMNAFYNNYCDSYWSNTAAYETLTPYLKDESYGVKDDILRLLSGASCPVNTSSFQNDMHVVRTRDDVFTLLIHLGYLSYNRESKTCQIPNREVAIEFENAIIADAGWLAINKALRQSDRLLNDTLQGNEEAVAEALELIHEENTSALKYNDENSLACALRIAYYTAKKDYFVYQELPAGKGFADIVLVPKPLSTKPPVILELKYNHSADTAIKQIHERRYAGRLMEYTGEVVLVGINYDKQIKQHECKIEKVRLNQG